MVCTTAAALCKCRCVVRTRPTADNDNKTAIIKAKYLILNY